ncbi:MAG: CDF family Co(II)/Ni(II) efflux transporter DmeF [Gammaproteobacteria bacterium]|nr:CDF family Co(II)/Ni(II) efflux transporter DmeF [Gammaproteobacteria bacterium]
MSVQNPSPTRHLHYFLGQQHEHNEKRVWAVVALTASMMVGEIVAGWVFGSMALLADGWHMFTHAGALTISALAYRYARRHVDDARYSFGTGKVGELAGFTSAVILALIALAIAYVSIIRLARPVPIAFDQAIAVAVLGLVVNLLSVGLLQEGSGNGHSHHAVHKHGHGDHDHPHDQGHDHVHDHGKNHDHGQAQNPLPVSIAASRDSNLRSAYLHVLADAATSILAIVGLLAGRLYGWVWMDALMGIVGALVIALWAWGLIADTSAVLLDQVPDPRLAEAIRSRLEQGGARVDDLHLWQVGPGHAALMVSLSEQTRKAPTDYKALLADLSGLSHITIETETCAQTDRVVSA